MAKGRVDRYGSSSASVLFSFRTIWLERVKEQREDNDDSL